MEYSIIRSSRKTLAVQITQNCEIIVRAPKLCSQRKIDTFLSEHSEWIENALKKQQKVKAGKVELNEETIAKLKALAKKILPEKAEYFAKIMGVDFSSVKITSAQKRFGSCNTKNNICFSYILMLYPESAVDYVVVHELAHTVHHDHSRQFYKCIEAVLPDYKEREKLLEGAQKIPDCLS
ncbi:MAG: M48 family metallopeptidase [Clostridia bacterium]|nr:M48 family metallopeptidase [Clostridia bacterium]